MPVRVSALRGLGAQMNVFAIESSMDELAAAAGVDPVEFRLAHLHDERARDVVKAAAERFGWANGGPGTGFAFARYKNLASHCAVAMEVRVDRDTGEIEVPRVVAAVDAGEAVNPDGIRNQIEGGIVQSLSWTTHEAWPSTPPIAPASTGAPIRSCVSPRCPAGSTCTSSTGRSSLSSAPAKPPRARRPPRSPMPSPMRWASACATCRCRPNG